MVVQSWPIVPELSQGSCGCLFRFAPASVVLRWGGKLLHGKGTMLNHMAYVQSDWVKITAGPGQGTDRTQWQAGLFR